MLNKQQEAAVNIGIDVPGVCINAGPGSGKTFSMVHRVKKLKELGVNIDKLIVVTLTTNAADEMWGRLEKAMPELKNTTLGRRVCTIHALNFRIWSKHTGKTLRVLSGQGESHFVLKNALEDIMAQVGFGWTQDIITPDGLYDWINFAKSEVMVGTNARAFFVMHLGPKTGDAIYEAFIRFNEWCEKGGWTTFADMLLNVDLLLRDPAMRKRYSGYIVIVDEAQDTNAQSMRILAALARNGQIWLCGDIAQSLFEFAGAHPDKNIGAGFETKYPNGVRLPLQINYRSTKAIIEAANSLVRYSFGRD